MTLKPKRKLAAFEILHLLHGMWDPPLYCKMSESVGSAACYCCELVGRLLGQTMFRPHSASSTWVPVDTSSRYTNPRLLQSDQHKLSRMSQRYSILILFPASNNLLCTSERGKNDISLVSFDTCFLFYVSPTMHPGRTLGK
jgi:hypothetical protein